MNYDIPLESDWKLFRKKVPNWQEAYMDKLIKKYTEMLNGEKLSSDKFWLLDKWIKKDQQKGVLHKRYQMGKQDNVNAAIRWRMH